MFQLLDGDIFDAKETYLCHQCNCVTNRSAHLATAVFSKYPYADVYTDRKAFDVPGTIKVRGDGLRDRYVIAMFAQYYPGKTKYPCSPKDGLDARFGYFKECLEEMKSLSGDFAFPWRIGCGAAGGDWQVYQKALKAFEADIDGSVSVYRLEAFKPSEERPTLF